MALLKKFATFIKLPQDNKNSTCERIFYEKIEKTLITTGSQYNLDTSIIKGAKTGFTYDANNNITSITYPDTKVATISYGTNGLIGSQFSYSTNYYDRTRYNQIYSTFVTRYGAPVNYQAVNNGYIATWFGYDNGYISLEFKPVYGAGGHLRYYTTLSFGL